MLQILYLGSKGVSTQYHFYLRLHFPYKQYRAPCATAGNESMWNHHTPRCVLWRHRSYSGQHECRQNEVYACVLKSSHFKCQISIDSFRWYCRCFDRKFIRPKIRFRLKNLIQALKKIRLRNIFNSHCNIFPTPIFYHFLILARYCNSPHI